MEDIITAVDIGTTKIVALAGERTESGKLKIIGKGTVPSPSKGVLRGVVLNINTVSEAIKEAIQLAEKQAEIEFKDVVVGIAGQHIQSMQSSHSIFIDNEEHLIMQSHVDKLISEIKNIVLEAGQEIIDVIPQSYTVDAETGVDEPVGFHGKKLIGNYHIIIGEKTSAKNIKKCFETLKINPRKLYLEPIASAEAVLTEEEKEAGIALVDIGGGTTDIAVFYDGILRHTAVIPFGGDVITNDIKEAYQILRKKAEELKIEKGTALSQFVKEQTFYTIPGINGREKKEIEIKELARVIQARMEEIIALINLELKNSGYREKLAAGITLTGGGALLNNLIHLVKYKTGLDVKIASPMDRLLSKRTDIDNPKYSTAAGLIMLASENADTYDFAKRKQKNKKEKKKEKKQKEKKENAKKVSDTIREQFNKISKTARQISIEFFNEEDVERSE